MGDGFGRTLRALRQARGLSLRQLARAAHLDPGHLSRIETGRRAPTIDLATALDAELHAGGTLLAWALTDDDDVLPDLNGSTGGRRIGRAAVDEAADRVHLLRLLDDQVGGKDSYAVARGEVDRVAALIRDGSYTEETGRRLLAVLGELCQIAGWVASDAGLHADARRLYLCGVRASGAGGDAATAANNLSSLSYQTANVGDRREALVLARTAERAGRDATGTVRALLAERTAWASARAGDDRAADRALGAVEDAYAERRPADDPQWVYWLDESEIAIMAGRVWTQLRRPLRAVPILEEATSTYTWESRREVALYLTWLAEALLQAREVDRAADTAAKALDLSRGAGSERATARVGQMRRLLLPHRGSPAVAAFEEQWRSAA